MTESLCQRVGGTELPLDVSAITAAATFEPCDPALNVIADLMAAAIRAELGSAAGQAWASVCATLPSGHRLANTTNSVGAVWKVRPSSTLMRQIRVSAWPLLTAWREGPGEYEQLTYCKEIIRQKWGVAWVLGDYEADLTLKLAPVLQMVGRVIAQTAIHGAHPAYESGTRQFGANRGWLQAIRPLSYDAGAAVFADDDEARFWCASATLETIEVSRDLDVGGEMDGLDLSLAAGNETELVPEFVIGSGDFPGV